MTDTNGRDDDREQTRANEPPTDTMNVDLSPTNDRGRQPAETPRDDAQTDRVAATHTPTPNGQDSADDYDAAAEAKRLVKNSDGDTAGERAETAIEHTRQTLRQISQRLQHIRQRETKTEERIEDLQEARVHIRRAPTDIPVFRSFGGGITVGVAPESEYDDPDEDERVPDPGAGADGHDEMPDEAGVAPADDVIDWSGVYDRGDLVRDIDETLEREQKTLARLREEQGKLSKGIGNAEAIIRELDDYRDKAGWLVEDDDDAGGDGPATQPTNRAREPDSQTGLTPDEIAQRRQQGVGVERDTEKAREDRAELQRRAENAQQAGQRTDDVGTGGATGAGGPRNRTLDATDSAKGMDALADALADADLPVDTDDDDESGGSAGGSDGGE